jgi:uncharacterized protein YciI
MESGNHRTKFLTVASLGHIPGWRGCALFFHRANDKSKEIDMWYLTLRRPMKPREQWTVSLDQHLVWMKQQHESGKILFSGPTTDRKLGIYVIRAGSKDEAEKIAASDPYTAAGFCAFELLEWEVHQIMGAGNFTAAGLQGHK